MPNKRSFTLSVDPSIIPITREKKKGYNAIQLNNGMYFNTRAQLTGSQIVQLTYLQNIEKFIKDQINVESRKLQQFWYQNVNKYFNRRAYGMFYYRGNRSGLLGSTRRFRGKYSNRQQYRRREHTGQLKRALTIRSKNLYGCELYVRPCYAKSGKPVDYVNILINGAGPKPKPYIPRLDKRINIPGKMWRGISRSYWAIWQSVFEKQVNQANIRLNTKIENYLIANKILERKDIKRVSAGARKTKDITLLNQTQLPRPKQKQLQTSSYVSSKWQNIFKKFQK